MPKAGTPLIPFVARCYNTIARDTVASGCGGNRYRMLQRPSRRIAAVILCETPPQHENQVACSHAELAGRRRKLRHSVGVGLAVPSSAFCQRPPTSRQDTTPPRRRQSSLREQLAQQQSYNSSARSQRTLTQTFVRLDQGQSFAPPAEPADDTECL